MQTECPHCHTIFRVKESQLEQADSQVRCGHCLAVFTADNPYNTVTYQDNNTPEKSQGELNSVDDFITDNKAVVADVIPPELRAETRQGKSAYGFFGTLLLTLAILASIAAGILQYAYYNRDELGSGYDLIIAGRSLYYADDLGRLLEKITAAMNPGAVFLCLHEGLCNERTGPAEVVLSRIGVALRGSDVSFERGELEEALCAAGLHIQALHNLDELGGNADLIVGVKA